MSDETEGGFLDHLFNAFSHLSRAQKAEAAKREAARAESGTRKPKKLKMAASFDEAPPASTCCTAKRE
jgi:hypothetical protein